MPVAAAVLDGLSPKLEQVIRVLEWSRIESLVHCYDSGPGRPQGDRCALASAFVAKAVLGLKTTRALIERLQIDSKLRRICGFEMYRELPSEATFSRAFDEFARSELAERAHEQMVKANLGDSLIGHVSRDATAIEARERVAKPACALAGQPEPTLLAHEPVVQAEVAQAPIQTPVQTPVQTQAQPGAKPKRGRPRKGEPRAVAAKAPSPLERQLTQDLPQMLAELPQDCSVGTKLNAKGYKTSWRGYKLHLDTACCGVVVSAVLTGAAVHDSRVALPLSIMTSQRVEVLYELMDAAYCAKVIREFVVSQARVPLIDHNPRGGEKIEFAPHEAQRYNTRTGAERSNARLKDEFGARDVWVRGAAKVKSHLMFGVVALCADQLMRLLK